MKACNLVGSGEECPLCDPMVDLSYQREGTGEVGQQRWMGCGGRCILLRGTRYCSMCWKASSRTAGHELMRSAVRWTECQLTVKEA